MQTSHIDNLAERQETYRRFWAGEKLGRPIVSIQAWRDHPLPYTPSPPIPADPEQMWLDPDFVIPNRLAALARTRFMGDSIPHVSVDLGPGSLASYLGSPTKCDHLTVWYRPTMSALSEPLPGIDEGNPWWQRHFRLISALADVGRQQGFYVALPDMIEGLDTLASLRGNQELVLDLTDDGQRRAAHDHIENITRLYLHYYNRLYDTVRDADGWSICTYLEPYGQGRTCKIQCDFAALLDPPLFKEFAVPFIEQQAAHYDFVSYHLDGPGAIYSAPMVAAIDKIRVIQWISGAGAAPEYDERWETRVIDTLVGAGKVVQIVFMAPFTASESKRKSHLENIIKGLTRLVRRYGPDSFWFTFKYGYTEAEANQILLAAAAEWQSNRG